MISKLRKYANQCQIQFLPVISKVMGKLLNKQVKPIEEENGLTLILIQYGFNKQTFVNSPNPH